MTLYHHKKKGKDEFYIFKNKTSGEKVVHAIVFVIFLIYALTLLVPMIWLLVQSLHEPKTYNFTVVLNGPMSFPEKLNFSNYVSAFSRMVYNNANFIEMVINSLWYIFIANTWVLFWPVLVGYIFSKYKFKGREPFYMLIIFTLIVPVTGTTGATIKLVNELGLYDKGPLLVIATGVSGFSSSFLIYYAIFKGISWDYAESVFVDGGGNFTAFIYIMLPVAMPAISAMMVTNIITQWNEYMQFMYYMPSTPPVAMGLYGISLSIENDKPIYYSALVISMIPVLIIYGFMAEGMMKNLTIGGLKG